MTDEPKPKPGTGKRSDCSQFVRACYLKAGAKDPGGNTYAQEASCTRTTSPKPGDLLLMPGHVELYIGDGKTIGHGSAPIDYGTVDSFKARGCYFGTYDFLDHPGGSKPAPTIPRMPNGKPLPKD